MQLTLKNVAIIGGISILAGVLKKYIPVVRDL